MHSDDHTSSSSSVDDKADEERTAEKAYRYATGRFLKRSLRPKEYAICSNGEPIVPLLVVERLKNEVACMSFIRMHTDIPVPNVLEEYDNDGSYHLWTEFINGVEMSDLTEEEQSDVLPEGKSTPRACSFIVEMSFDTI
jgi:tRNA A-37 threonylcarbamoyl transferase component Bud32